MPSPDRPSLPSGFTLIELMVAIAVTAIVVSGTALTWLTATRSSRKGGIDVQLDGLIDEDIARIQDLSNRFTCCPGTCTSDPDAIAAAVTAGDCSTSAAQNEDYYAPRQTNSATDRVAMRNFRALCRNPGGPADAFIAEINNTDRGVPSVPSHQSPLSLRRTEGPSISDAASNRIRIQYEGTDLTSGNVLVRRVVELIPRVANWCP